MREAGRNPGGLAGNQVEPLLADLGDGLSLEDEDGLLDVVAVQRQPGARSELRLPGGDRVGLAVPAPDVGDGDDPVAAVERLDLVRADEQGRGEWLVSTGVLVAGVVGGDRGGRGVVGGASTRASTMARVSSAVPRVPPRSRVRVAGSARTELTAASSTCHASRSSGRPARAPCQSSSMPADRTKETGLATPSPAMSGAEPCCACATQRSCPALTAPPRPRLPHSSEASSLRMSPNMFVVTMTSNDPGRGSAGPRQRRR